MMGGMRNAKLKWVICWECQGNCKVDNPAFSNGFTSSEWAEMDHDDQDTYMRGGYDVPCEPCSGTGKVQVPDVAAMTFGEKRLLVLERRDQRADAAAARAIRAEVAAERRMGC
jgi:RecJ-like exonuclease